MSTLIDELKREHKAIVAALGQVKRLGIGSREGQDTLMSARNLLLDHLQKEDERIYPMLRRAAQRDDDLRQTLEFYATNMSEITEAALHFFDKYANGGSGIEFGQDFGALYSALSLRVAKEEAAIYKRYEELQL